MGFISCKRIFQIEVSPGAAPFIPSICLVLAVRSATAVASSLALIATDSSASGWLEFGLMGVESDIRCTSKGSIGYWAWGMGHGVWGGWGSVITIACSLLPILYCLLPVPCSLFPIACSLKRNYQIIVLKLSPCDWSTTQGWG